MLLPPNMNVLEVQWTKATGATLYEVDFTNSLTKVKVITACVDVPDARRVASRLASSRNTPMAKWRSRISPPQTDRLQNAPSGSREIGLHLQQDGGLHTLIC